MRKGLHPQMQYISYSGRLMNIMMTKISHTGKVHHMRAKHRMAQSLGQIAKFKRRYELEAEENNGRCGCHKREVIQRRAKMEVSAAMDLVRPADPR
uniref:Ribosomal protein L31 n=1 Tax=Oryza rufipogon TaxID=4529 RepID=A0A0E0RH89_ORYRU